MWAEIGTYGRIQRTRPHQPQHQDFQLEGNDYPVLPGGSTHHQDTHQGPQPSTSHQRPSNVTTVQLHNPQDTPRVSRNPNQNGTSNQQQNQPPGPIQQDQIQELISDVRNNPTTPRAPQQPEVSPVKVISNEVDNLKKELAKQMDGIIKFLVLFIGLLPQDAHAKENMVKAAKQLFGEKAEQILLSHQHPKKEPLESQQNNQSIIYISNLDESTTFSAIEHQTDTPNSQQQNDAAQK